MTPFQKIMDLQINQKSEDSQGVNQKVVVCLKQKELTDFPVDNIFLKIGLEEELNYNLGDVSEMDLSRNSIIIIPPAINRFHNIRKLDLGTNRITHLPDEILNLHQLQTFNCKNNRLNCDSLPKDFGKVLLKLESLNMSGNLFKDFPEQLLEMSSLKVLHLGGNRIRELPEKIDQLESLENLYLGGNHISTIPTQLGNLTNLMCLVFCDNRIMELPIELSYLKKLQSLSLHNNQLTTLPRDIVKLTNLRELSLRGNPLVVRFVRELTWEAPTLLELAARTIKNSKVAYDSNMIPTMLVNYLETACHCLNPDCNGVYFDSHVESVKFVDFCGKFRLPLMHYLCSPRCYSPSTSCSSTSSSSDNESDDDVSVPSNRIKKVLLG